MKIEFEGQEFKSEKERNKYCFYNLKNLKEKYKQKYIWKEWVIIFLPFVLCIGIPAIWGILIPGLFMGGFFYMIGMLIFYKSKKIKNIILWAKNYEFNFQEEIEKEKRMVEEYERKCKKCGEAWHSLKNDEESLIMEQKLSGLIGIGSVISGHLSSSVQSNRNAQASRDRLKDLKKCPKCGSQNYSEKITKFEKKD